MVEPSESRDVNTISTGDAFRLDGKVAAVTGTSRGIGQAIAVAFAAAGADIVQINRNAADHTRADIEKLGQSVIDLDIDLAMVSQRDAKIEIDALLEDIGNLHILVNNAGAIERSAFEETPEASFRRVFDTNLSGALHLTQAVGTHFLENRRGKIVNITSLLAFQGGLRVASYATSKHALLGLTRALCNEWADRGVNVNAIAPGYVITDVTRELRANQTRAAEIVARIPAGRWGVPQDIAGAAVFLASPASDYVNGQTLVVDGGWMSR